ncbi:MAG: hypothetical protein A3F91_02135 [Flavobacteria bacterium RIFCSPLOWO2_12_FULL_35_11]|nr:MAG: hypothetical protein A3F91_02135 [Flavobacteria bacterium RIFCSPLOWO2_12_FULL_35_11]
MNDFIKTFWEKQASKHKTSHTASWGNNYAIDLEIETIGVHIKESDVVLDIGCANVFLLLDNLTKENLLKYMALTFLQI